MNQDRLGRGLSALIPDSAERQDAANGISVLPTALIKANRFQPRLDFDESALSELAESIKENGIIQPLIVTKTAGSDYELIAGERRLQAAKLAGLEKVPVVIRSVSPLQQLQLAIIENIQREDLSPIEEALAYQALAESHGLSHQEIARVMGKSRVAISNSIRLLKLPEAVITLVSQGLISAGHARAVLSVEPKLQETFAAYIVKYRLTVRQAEDAAKSFGEKPAERHENKEFNREMEAKFGQLFGIKAKVQDFGNTGKITLEYKNPVERQELLDTLERLKK